MALLLRVQQAADAHRVRVAEQVFPQVRDVLASRPRSLGITLRVADPATMRFGPDVFGVYVQSPDDHGALVDLAPDCRAGARRRRARGRRHGPAVARDRRAARRGRRGRRRRQRAAVRRAARVRRTARGVLRDARAIRAAGARPHHRRLGRRRGPPRLPHGAADARAAHPAREGDVEHLHGAGAARQHGGVLRRVSRARRPARTSPRACTIRRRRLAAAVEPRSAGAQTNAAYFDTLRLEGDADRGRAAARRPPRRAASTSATRRPDVVQISLNETVSEADLADIVAAFGDAGGRPRHAAAASAPRRAAGAASRARRRS